MKAAAAAPIPASTSSRPTTASRNGEGNRDGESHNNSWNCGVEGPTKDPKIIELRERQKRNLLATLILSQGVPMILAGDEIGRTQRGNNNAYCQDNDISWVDWRMDERRRNLLEFTQRLTDLFHEHPTFRRRKFFQGKPILGSEVKDITWFRPDGEEMTPADWSFSGTRVLGLLLLGDAINEVDDRGNPILDDTMLVLLNAYHEALPFTLPSHNPDLRWSPLLDTRFPQGRPNQDRLYHQGDDYHLVGRSLALLMAQEIALPIKRRFQRAKTLSRLRRAFWHMIHANEK
jgi:glycogen operon protein